MVIWEHDKIIERWKGYYGNLLNEENPRTVFGKGVPNEGLTPATNSKEVEVVRCENTGLCDAPNAASAVV